MQVGGKRRKEREMGKRQKSAGFPAGYQKPTSLIVILSSACFGLSNVSEICSS